MPDRSSLTLTGVLALLGFLVVTAGLSARAAEREERPRRAELVELIEARRALVDDLDARLEDLRRRVTQLTAAVNQRTALGREAAEEARALSAQAGTVAMAGPGVVVRLDNSTRQPSSPDEAGAYLIHDTDVQLVVNALFAAGAEAVSVNGSRIVATTPIRAAGDTIVVNFRPLTPPYEISAIGADEDLFAESEIATRFRRWSKLFGLGFAVSSKDDVRVEAYTGRVKIRTAVPSAGAA